MAPFRAGWIRQISGKIVLWLGRVKALEISLFLCFQWVDECIGGCMPLLN